MGATMGKNGGTILDSLPSTQGTLHIVMLGLDSAGKTTALYRLKFDQYLNTVPTIGFNCEKVRGACGKAKGAQFLVWDVGGQEKLRPLWRSYTRCTDGIVFVLDSVDVERMEEAKMELMRTAKCPDNQGVPVLILANKQDLPNAREPKHIEKLLGLHELSPIGPMPAHPNISANCASSANASSAISASASSATSSSSSAAQHNQSNANHSITSSSSSVSASSGASQTTKHHNASGSSNHSSSHSSGAGAGAGSDSQHHHHHHHSSPSSNATGSSGTSTTTGSSATTTTTTQSQSQSQPQPMKGWYIQPACAITGEGLQEGLEALYEMIIKKRKLNKTHRKKR